MDSLMLSIEKQCTGLRHFFARYPTSIGPATAFGGAKKMRAFRVRAAKL